MTDAWTAAVLATLASMDEHLRRVARRQERRTGAAPEIEPLPKFPAVDFDYLTELRGLADPEPIDDSALLDEVAQFFRGALRPESPYCLFNSDFRPSIEATAAACLTVLHNVNGLMDAFGGESLLVEQKVARTLGRWAGWPDAMGISCGGGKITMQYAMRSAISRAQPDSLRVGVQRALVVLCSAGAHYSVEHVAALTGIGSHNCLRVPVDAGGSMIMSELRRLMDEAHASGATVAAVVCSGGTTIDFCCDDTSAASAVVDEYVTDHDLTTRPYLHFDGVIGWLYLSFADQSPAQIASAVPDAAVRARIVEVNRRSRGLARFDSLGADFHKTGLCPYSSSFFIARDHRFMDELGTGDYSYGDQDFAFGRLRAYRYTVENSRPMLGVLAAWVNLQRLGRAGLREYLVMLHRSRAGLEGAIERHGRFTPLNKTSLGWEVVVDLPLADGRTADESIDDVAIAFMESCWVRVREGQEIPLFSIVPGYCVDHDPAEPRTAFLVYPMNDIAPSARDAAITAIGRALDEFVDSRRNGRRSTTEGASWTKPIR